MSIRTRNKLLNALPGGDLNSIASQLEHVTLPRGEVLASTGNPVEHIYFLSDGIGSVFARTPGGHSAEVGIFGYEGYIPSSAAVGSELSSYDIVVQVDAEGHRVSYESFRSTMQNNRHFALVMVRAIETFAVQVAYTAVSNAVHDVNERLARWLLMCDDRVIGDEIAITHDFLARMLAVRRPSVTTALHILEGNGFIKSERGLITMRNRAGLEEFGHDSYGRPEAEYRRLMADLF
ncbi:CRP-like cAMP-binding protein [Neorhizobium huautlense]|uniref:CRP-like cAMP-binding protein n=1 Tax=Neorhizobium huautlense TaxID=67774 RepID=A0ABT9PRD1_9HYPH|nr:Crp/Fnr family transcriptional regulator [Neorhizobium huautlense]MDP9837012.1 CRP-like cAMP-binding protein [Neorhizobium huautlense]